MEDLEDELLEAIFDKSVSNEELEELFFSIADENEENDVDLLETWLEQENLTYDNAVKQRGDKITRLLELAREFEFPLEHSFQTCKKISEQDYFTEELEEFLSLFLSEQRNLLKPNEELSEKELMKDYAFLYPDYQKTRNALSVIESLRQNWMIHKSKLNKKFESDLPTSNVVKEELLKIYTSVFGTKKITEFFDYNLDVLLGEINSHESIRKVAPLYIYQVIIKHNSRLQTSKDIVFNPKSLWCYKKYELQRDNGKNFNKNRLYLTFFERLCTLFQKDIIVNIPLSRWGFMLLSNLVDFQRSELEDKSESVFPYFDNLVETSFFSCFGNAEKEAELLHETGYSLKQVSYFQSEHSYQPGLERISQYMNQNALSLLQSLEDAKFTHIKNICVDILIQSKLKKKEKPASQREIDLYLCSINIGLLDLVDYFAQEYLVLGLLNIFRNDH